jgi:hypothetical protein
MSNEKIEAFWVDATADDVAEIANTRKPISARVRDEENEVWREDLISGWRLSRFVPGAVWIDADGVHWEHCQVYREPSWHANKPEPGPGYRLLGKFPDESRGVKDDVFVGGKWLPARWDDGKQLEGTWYRRRIEPVEPKEPKFAVGQTVRVIGPKGSDARHWSEKMNIHLGRTSPIKVREKKDDDWFYELGCSAIWAFREDYLEAVEADRGIALSVGDVVHHPSGLLLTITAKGFEVSQ